MRGKAWEFCKRYGFLYPAVYLAKAILKAILKTCTIHITGFENFVDTPSEKPRILMLWHNRLVILPEILHTYAPQYIYRAVISKSKDGELLAILAHSYAVGRTLRVAHNARYQALSQIISQLQQGGEVIILTPDGPRGPRYRLKPGIALAAKKGGALVVPFTWSASAFWQLKSWDKLIVPKPFSTVHITFGEPVDLQKEPERSVEGDLKELEKAMHELDSVTCARVTPDTSLWPL